MGTENLKIEYYDPKILKPYQNNARHHEDLDINAIRESIRKFGFADPIGVWSDELLIVEGHGRQLAAIEEGMDKVPCIRLDWMTDEERRAYAIAHNRTAELSTWDTDLLKIELSALKDIDLSSLKLLDVEGMAEEETAQDDGYEITIPKEPKSHEGDIYQLGGHRLICGDSTNSDVIAELMGGVQADLYLTDPPYNVNYSNSAGRIANDDLGNDEFRAFLTKAFKTAYPHLKSGAAFYIWHADAEGYNFRGAAEDAGLHIRQCLVWNKNGLILGRNDYQWKHEPCLYGWKDGKHFFTDDRKQATVIEDPKPNFKKMKKDELLDLVEHIYSDKVSTTVIDEKKPTANDKHPTMKPIKLLAKLIKNSSKQKWVVLDSFGGSGSTMIACEQLNRKCYMCELDPHYVDVIIDRWESFTGSKAVLVNR